MIFLAAIPWGSQGKDNIQNNMDLEQKRNLAMEHI